MSRAGPHLQVARLLWPVACISAAMLGFEIALLRILLVASWHHFAFLVISVALLGFGASGTLLSMCRPWMLERGRPALFCLLLLTAVSMPLCVATAQLVPIEARFVPALLMPQLGRWVLFWALLGAPFLFAGSAIGLSLMMAGDRVPLVYASNLVGSGVGAIGATLAMSFIAPQWLPVLAGIVACASVVGIRAGSRGRRVSATTLALGIIAAWTLSSPPVIRVDPYKFGAYVKQLQEQEIVERVAVAYGPRGTIEIYRGDVFHELPFLSMDAAPPALDAVVIDGHGAGSLLRVDSADEAGAVDHTLMSVPYALLPERPAVLLLGEIGGGNVWLALRHDASPITVVQPDPKIIELLGRRELEASGSFLRHPEVETHLGDPRHFIDHCTNRYDLIQPATLESMAAGTGGITGLAEDYLITVEGFEAILRALTDDGVLSVCRGIQDPPRDNLKLLTTAVAALERLGVESPQDHIVIVRDFLAVCTLVKRTPWSMDETRRVREVCQDRSLTPVWFSGVRDDELNRPDRLPGPPNTPGDWYHHAAVEVFSPATRQRFVDDWMFGIRPATDNRPFFLDFCRLRSIATLREAFGDLWLTRAELAYLFVLVAAAMVTIAGVVLTIVPLLGRRSIRSARGKWVSTAYFGAIGLGYLLLEMVVISRLTHLIGDPIHAAASAIAAFLFFSGLGSLAAQRFVGRRSAMIQLIIAVLVVVGLLTFWLVIPLASSWSGGWSLSWRIVAGVAAVAPLAVLMGFPMPSGLARLDRGAPALLPWAWGINGFASVLAAPLASVTAMTWGFHVTSGLALVMYAAAAGLLTRLPDRGESLACRVA